MPSQAKQSAISTSKRRLQRQIPMSEAMESESWSRKPNPNVGTKTSRNCSENWRRYARRVSDVSERLAEREVGGGEAPSLTGQALELLAGTYADASSETPKKPKASMFKPIMTHKSTAAGTKAGADSDITSKLVKLRRSIPPSGRAIKRPFSLPESRASAGVRGRRRPCVRGIGTQELRASRYL